MVIQAFCRPSSPSAMPMATDGVRKLEYSAERANRPPKPSSREEQRMAIQLSMPERRASIAICSFSRASRIT